MWGATATSRVVDASAIISAAQAVSLATGAPSPLPGASLTRSGALVLARSAAFYVDPPTAQSGPHRTLRVSGDPLLAAPKPNVALPPEQQQLLQHAHVGQVRACGGV